MKNRPTVAVVGSGISGLTAAYILRKKYDVTLYEAAERLGGHTHTHQVTDGNGDVHSVDSGFIIHNIHTYPLLLKLFKELDITTTPTDMSMSVSCRGCGLEYAIGKGYGGIFAMPSALLRPKYLKLLRTVVPFFKDAKKFLNHTGNDTVTLGEFLKSKNYGSYFNTHFILPIVSGVWSCNFTEAKQYPARYLFQFMYNHSMLEADTLGDRGDWRVVEGGSSAYIQKITALLHNVVSESPVISLERKADGMYITTSNAKISRFDKVIVATHPDQALALLSNPTSKERQVLGSFKYTETATQLHTDTALLPLRKKAAGSWNYLITSCVETNPTMHFSYDMNRIEHINSPDHYIVSLDSTDLVRPEKVIATMKYSHPLFTLESVAAQAELPLLNTDSLAFAGAYHGWGFHEDGCRSGVAAAAALGVEW